MSEYVGYHNPDKMGFRATERDGFDALTDKQVSQNVRGSRLWHITGEGKPRKYYLARWSIIDAVEPTTEHGFTTRIKAHSGRNFDPMIRLDQEDWFPDFRRSQANFSLGFRPLSDERIVTALERLAAEASEKASHRNDNQRA